MNNTQELIELHVKTFPVSDLEMNDLRRMKAVLNARGYDSTYHHIQLAYELYSEEYYSAMWYSINGLSDDWIFDALMRYMRPHDPDPVESPNNPMGGDELSAGHGSGC